MDLLPTIAEITGSEMPGDRVLDGTSILPVLLEEPFERERPLYWFFYKRYPISALRKGDYMILGNPGERYILNSHPFDSIDQVYFKNTKLEEFQVYNLSDDPGQKNDLYPTDSVMFRNLKKEIIKYHKEIIEEGPNWSSLPRE